MYYDEILNNIKKYHLLACNGVKSEIISSSSIKYRVRDKLITSLKSKWNELIGISVFCVIIRKSTKEIWNKEKHILSPGPLYIQITEHKIKNNYKLKLIDKGINGNVYFTENYLKKNKKIRMDDIKSLVLKYKKGELKKGLTQKNII